MNEDRVGTSRDFVLSQGFTKVGTHAALIGADGTQRVFAELTADPDRPEVRPVEAYQAILSSMQPGWTIRWLQIFWPDPGPRDVFLKRAQAWQSPSSAGLSILQQGLILSAQTSPLPFSRRTILEFVYPGGEGLAWWEGLGGMCQAFGITVHELCVDELQILLKAVLNPRLE